MDESERNFSEPAVEAGAEPASAPADGDAPLDAEAIRERVLESLKDVVDPELGINIVDLGLVYEVDIVGDTVFIKYTLTTMGCPIGPLIEAQMQQTLAGIDGVDRVEAEMVFSPPWTPDKMSEEAKAALGYF